ncbi:MAG: polyprenyl synthetase family protein, partial [Candidatus Omnitrophica bacterium]|nr:polyprenyl synthetase family protein [Candidatus Omnitrophota bacterium]
MQLKTYLESNRKAVDKALDKVLTVKDEVPKVLLDSIRYSVFAGGKRIRPILCLCAGEVVGAQRQAVMPVACAIELIHTYSLIHDDLPALDNDDFRRGKPSNHKVFGEDIAIG